MATTSDQDSRTAAPWTDFELKFFVGADRMLGDVELTAGGAYDPEASTYLTTDVGTDDDHVYVASTVGFTTGFIAIHPEAAGEHYEVMAYDDTYSNEFYHLTRFEPDGEKRFHSAGATVSEWMEVTEYLYGDVSIDLNHDDEISDWSANIKGHSYLSTVFQPDRAFLCMWRFRPYNGSMSTWSSWQVGFIGFLQDVSIDGDWKEANLWTAKVVSLGFYVNKTDVVSGVTYGKIDLASGRTVEVSSHLEDVYQEAESGEFYGTPSLDGDRAVDDDISTLWVSDGEPAPTIETPVASGGNINEVYLRAEPWMPDGLQWFELRGSLYPNGFSGSYIASKVTTWGWTGWDPDGRHPKWNYLKLPPTPPLGDFFGVFTNDKAMFMAHFPGCTANVYDWRSLQVGNFSLDPTGDFISLRLLGVQHVDIIWWDGGLGGWALYDFCGGGSHYYDAGGTNYSGWTGAMCTVPPVGHTIRSDPTGNRGGTIAFYEQDEDHPTPGDAITGEPEYIIVDLGSLGISLDSALAMGATTEAALDGHLGLTDGPAYASIDPGGASHEIISYQSVDRINNKLLTLTRGEGGTSDQAHSAGEAVQQYESGAATDNHLLQTVRWRRRPVLDSSGLSYVVPRHFDVYATIYSTGFPKPDEAEWDDGIGSGGWEDYWDRIASVRWYSQTGWQKTLSAPIRARNIMVSFMGMSDGGRVKLNSLYAYGPTGYVLTAGEEDDSFDAGFSSSIISSLLETWLAMDESNITLSAGGRQVYKLDVTRDRIANAIRDICKSAGTTVYFRLDNTVEVDWNTLLGMGGWPSVFFYWTRSNSRSIQFSRKTRTNVAQVIVKLTDSENEEMFEAVWPSSPFPLGDIIEENESLLIGDEDDAASIAEMLYHSRSQTDTVDIVVKGIAEWALPGQRHVITFDVDGDDTYLNGHNIVVTGVTHSIALGDTDGTGKQWITRITAKRVEYA